MAKIILDAGHGGSDPGAVFENRQEKNDTLRLALAVGQILTENGVDVSYTRVTDTYHSPQMKADMANAAGGDFFLSFHRNATDNPVKPSGSLSLVYENSGPRALLAGNINQALAGAGFTDLGIDERPGLIVLRKTEMPAVLVEAGFLDNPADNAFFDRNFAGIAQAIADGVLTTIQEEEEEKPVYYQIQVGAYRDRSQAEELLGQLLEQDYPAFLVAQDGYYKVRSGAFLNLDHAARMEQRLRNDGYQTYMVTK